MTTNLTLYSPGGRTLASPAIGEGSEARFSLMQEDSLTLRFSLVEPVYFPVGSYTVVPEPEGDELGLPVSRGVITSQRVSRPRTTSRPAATTTPCGSTPTTGCGTTTSSSTPPRAPGARRRGA